MERYFLPFFVGAGFAYLLTPLIRKFAQWAKIYDFPSERKIHRDPVPLLGGISIFLAFNTAIILAIIFDSRLLDDSFFGRWQALLACQTIILGLGVCDDILRLQPGVKFLFQVMVGILIVLFGFGIENVANPFSGEIINLGIFSIPLTVIWLVLITNALNLVDGLDGLAAGTSLIVAATIFAVSFFNQNTGVAIASVALGGSLLGFIRYNFYPAKIFLGDTGSLLLGFLLAIFSIQGSSKGATMVAVLAPILALGLPIMETLLSMIRRFLKSVHLIDYPTKNGSFRTLFFKGTSMFKADSDHVHHRLLKMGFSQRKAVVILYGICIALSALAILSISLANLNVTVFLAAIILAIFIGIKSLKYQEFKILESGLLIPIFNFPIVNRRLFHAFFDMAMISVSSYLSFVLILKDFEGQARSLFVESLPLLLLIKIVVFYLSGLYRKSWAYSSMEEMGSILGAVFLSSLVSALLCELIFGIALFGGLVFFVLDFYLLLTFAGGFRFSYRILTSYYKKGTVQQGKKILIYGAGHKGSAVLKEIRHNGNYLVVPVGFLDDDPGKKGRILHGCPILGSFGDLEEILESREISEIVISTGKIAKDKIKNLISICHGKGIILRQFEFRFYEFS
jgi:UDP-GlcNAc:undecaprenyl-phosphate GlcNAc-1-phosphate transferase